MTCRCEQTAGRGIALSPFCISRLWIFQNLEAEEREALCQNALLKNLTTGQALFLQGEPADEVFLIKGGRVKLSKLFEDGTELTLDIRKAGEIIGENMFSEESHCPVSAYCLENTLTCGFSRSQFEQLVLQHPKIGLQVIKNLSERIAWLTRRVGSVAVTNIEERLYRVLTSVAREHGKTGSKGTAIQFPLTHEDLSFLTGAHRVSITRAMKTLKAEGKVIHEGKQLTLPALKMTSMNTIS